jgi:hypothetical protein
LNKVAVHKFKQEKVDQDRIEKGNGFLALGKLIDDSPQK